MEINIINLQKKIPLDPVLSAKIKRTVLTALDYRRKGRVNICLAGNREIRLFNKRFLNKNRPTDVISFNTSEKPLTDISAEIIISVDKAVSNSKIFKTTPLYELLLYAVHGILHVLGYDDRTKRQRAVMQKKEVGIVSEILNPCPSTRPRQ